MRPPSTEGTEDNPPDSLQASETTYERLLTEAAAMFRRYGYEGTSTRALAEVLGIQKASLYHHMSSKEQLLYEVSTRSMDRMDARIHAAVQAQTEPVEKLIALIESHVTAMLEHPDPYAANLLELRSLKGEHARQLLQRRREYERLVVRMVEAAQDNGAIRKDIEAQHLGRLLLGTMNWLLFWYRPEGPLSPEDVAAMVRAVTLDGLLVREPYEPGKKSLTSRSQPTSGRDEERM